MKKVYYVVGLLAVVGVLYSCHRQQKQNVPYNPTPYTLQYPSFVDSAFGSPAIPADNPLTKQGVALGRRLFFEKMLSGDGTMSCARCHQPGNAFDDTAQFSHGITGALGSRNSMAVVNVAWSSHFFWDGRRNSLEGQAHDPVTNPIEMNTTWPEVMNRLQHDADYPSLFYAAFGTSVIDSTLITKAIAQFERTLFSFNSAYDKYAWLHTSILTSQQAQGYELFQVFKCTKCHTFGLFTDNTIRNNGLDLLPSDSGLAKATHLMSDYGKFKVPTLRNIAMTAPYMHDGRFATLAEVLRFYSKNVIQASPNLDSNMHFFTVANAMSPQEQADIVAFLETLTDSSFLNNPDFNRP